MSANPHISHKPVMLKKALEALHIIEDGIYVDCTFGRGGHSRGILAGFGERGRLIAFDRDSEAVAFGRKNIRDERFELIADRFSNTVNILQKKGLARRVDGVLLDLGICSAQVDNALRGFSFQHNGPLDMRMDNRRGEPVSAWLSRADEDEIADVLYKFGEEKRSRRIAKEIVNSRANKKITTTSDLVECIKKAVPRRGKKHPATRSFQALRIFINREFAEIKTFLSSVRDILRIGGYLVVISFHSLEDRIVKQFMLAKKSGIPAEIPLKINPAEKSCISNIGKYRPGKAEIAENPRARSAVMRVARRIC